MTFQPIPACFVCCRLTMNWHEILWGYERRLIGWRTVVDLACDKLTQESNNILAIELAGVDKPQSHQVGDLLRRLAAAESRWDEAIARRKWLFLCLAWLFENRSSFPDPLVEVESVYADFNYPKEIEHFIYYMPPSDGYDPSQHTSKENEDHLFSSWKAFIELEKEVLKNLND